ncbi:malate dehydrogenase [Listeria grandensis FSL F6-0971]|uniref:Malate dehydrogenase n=1 Tax=Listeria grandensis FSL F6-0971 TaxID=1265819 RepID=W7BN99_9LIST|nr:malate dehydrogenase [Listeria grandensis FSL F6-0971]
MMNGYARLNDPFTNKGTAFTATERAEWGLDGLIPATIETLEQQAARVYTALHKKTNTHRETSVFDDALQ